MPGCGQAGGNAERDHRQGLPADHRADIAGPRAEGHADADFATALRHGVGKQAIDSHGGEHTGQQAEERCQGGRQAFGGGAGIHLFGQGMDFEEGQGRIERGQLAAHRLNDALRPHVRAHDESEPVVGANAVEGRRNGFAEGAVLGVIDDADDFVIGAEPIAETVADGIDMREELVHERLVDHRARRFDADVGRLKSTAFDDAHTHRREIPGRDCVGAGIEEVGLVDLLAAGRNGGLHAAAAHDGHGRGGGGDHTRQGADAVEQGQPEFLALLEGVAGEAGAGSEGDHMVAVEARVHAVQLLEAADQQVRRRPAAWC